MQGRLPSECEENSLINYFYKMLCFMEIPLFSECSDTYWGRWPLFGYVAYFVLKKNSAIFVPDCFFFQNNLLTKLPAINPWVMDPNNHDARYLIKSISFSKGISLRTSKKLQHWNCSNVRLIQLAYNKNHFH